jgi:hypothetical protein
MFFIERFALYAVTLAATAPYLYINTSASAYLNPQRAVEYIQKRGQLYRMKFGSLGMDASRYLLEETERGHLRPTRKYCSCAT